MKSSDTTKTSRKAVVRNQRRKEHFMVGISRKGSKMGGPSKGDAAALGREVPSEADGETPRHTP